MNTEGLLIPVKALIIKIFFGIVSFLLVGFITSLFKDNILADYVLSLAMIFLYITVIFADTWKTADVTRRKGNITNPHFGHIYAAIFSLIQLAIIFIYYLSTKGIFLNFMITNIIVRVLYSPFMPFFSNPVENMVGLSFYFFWIVDYVVIFFAYYMGVKNKKIFAPLLDKLIGLDD